MKRIFLILGIVFLFTMAYGQNASNTSIYVDIASLSNKSMAEADGIETEGSPFLDPTYTEGAFKIKNTKYITPMRFNVYLDAFEVEQETYSMFINGHIVDTVYYNSSKFAYKKENNKLKAYEILSTAPQAELLKKYKVSYSEGQIGIKGKRNSYPRYKSEKPEYYFAKTNEEKIQIKGIKNLASLFPEKKDDIKAFIKANKLKKKKERDLITLFNYVALQ
jgi:hypothetical protein